MIVFYTVWNTSIIKIHTFWVSPFHLVHKFTTPFLSITQLWSFLHRNMRKFCLPFSLRSFAGDLSLSICFCKLYFFLLFKTIAKVILIQVSSLLFPFHHLNNRISLFLNIWPHIALDFAEDLNPIDIYLKGSQFRKVYFFIFLNIKILVIFLVFFSLFSFLILDKGCNPDVL